MNKILEISQAWTACWEYEQANPTLHRRLLTAAVEILYWHKMGVLK